MWKGSAGVCINNRNELLMVLQGKPEEPKVWAIPSGGLEKGESFEECCLREIGEETGYKVQISHKLHVKTGTTYGIDVEVHYYRVQLLGGEMTIQDPDGLIYEIAWVSKDEVQRLELSFPEDLPFLLDQFN